MSCGVDNSVKWAEYKASEIPTKLDMSHITQSLTNYFEREHSTTPPTQYKILDFGCGTGEVSLHVANMFGSDLVHITGVDINAEAIEKAKQISSNCKNIHFFSQDILECAFQPQSFHVILLQLVISVVGDKSQRKKLLDHVFQFLTSGGMLYLSASGVSDEINEGYAQLYAQDQILTGEPYTYYSRDAETGEILYMTHHFTSSELYQLLEESGFTSIQINKVKETSSRRPTEGAYFFYVTAHKA